MKGAPVTGLAAGLALAACNSMMDPSDPNRQATSGGDTKSGAATGGGPAADGAGASVAGIYVARRPQSTLVGHRARFAGRFGLRARCLIFEGGGAVYLPIVARQTPVRVFDDRVEIGGRTHRFDRDTVIVGGATDASAAAGLDQSPPADCPWPLLQVSGVQ